MKVILVSQSSVKMENNAIVIFGRRGKKIAEELKAVADLSKKVKGSVPMMDTDIMKVVGLLQVSKQKIAEIPADNLKTLRDYGPKLLSYCKMYKKLNAASYERDDWLKSAGKSKSQIGNISTKLRV